MTVSAIEWTEQVWNPLVGCTVHSPGCTNCYAMRMAHRLQAMAEAGNDGLAHYLGTTRKVNGHPVWTGRIGFSEHTLLAQLRRRKPTRWFVNSMSDLFHEAVSDVAIDRIFAVMALCPQHTFQVLTKRSARMRRYASDTRAGGPGRGTIERVSLEAESFNGEGLVPAELRSTWPLPNVWLGVSVEDQARADLRIPDLLATPAAVRWISAEPLLGPVDLRNIDFRPSKLGCGTVDVLDHGVAPALDWVVAGGESGPGSRPMHPDWARALRDQCAAAGVSFFFKQWGEWGPDVGRLDTVDRNGIRRDPVMDGLGPCRVLVDGRWQEFADGYAVPIELCSGHGEHVYRWGKKRANLLRLDHHLSLAAGLGPFTASKAKAIAA